MVAMLGLLSVVAIPAFAQTNPPTGGNNGNGWANGRSGMMGNRGASGQGMRPGIFGTVVSVNGYTLTVNGRGPGANQATTTYTVNATNATVVKNNATSTIAVVLVGDTVSVRGTVTGTNMVATSIRDGVMVRGPGYVGPGGTRMPGANGQPTQNPIIKGNGQPVVAGTVATVNGNSLTITTSSNVTYTIDATNATVAKGNVASTISGITVGDYVVVQGTVAGQAVVASSVIDQPAHPITGNGSGNTPGNGESRGQGGGVFGSIGQFFKHLFGF